MFPAFQRKAAQKGFQMITQEGEYPAEFYKDGQSAFEVKQNGEIWYHVNTPFQEDMKAVVDVFMEMRDVYEQYIQSRALEIPNLANYRGFAEYGDCLLAAYMTRNSNLQFVTWEYDKDRNGVHGGNYFGDHYRSASRDFATRVGLVEEERQFTENEQAAMYAACVFRGRNDEEITFDEERELQKLITKLENLVEMQEEEFDICYEMER
jgi:hypothetical protein